MMFSLPLHKLAAERGDGLHPVLLAVLELRQAVIAAGAAVEDLAERRGETHIQAGPHPTVCAGTALPDGVARFAPRPASPIGPAKQHSRKS